MNLNSQITIITLNQSGITDYATARNIELAKVKTPWVLFVDSDEKITPDLKNEVLSAIESNTYDAYRVARLDTFLGRQLRYGEPGHTKLIRLAKRDFGQWVRPVHEVWIGQGRVGTLTHPLLHAPHATIASFLDKINRYSTLEAEYRFNQGFKSSLWKIVIYPVAKFKYNYLLRQGFRDGVPGMVMAIMMSFHSYLTWTKLYLLWHKK